MSAGLPPRLSAIRPTTGGRIGLVFSLNTEYWHANTHQLFQLNLSITPWWVLSSFIASISLWMMNEKVRNHYRGVNKLYGLYLLHQANGQIHVYLSVSSVQIINKHIALPCTDSSEPGRFHIVTYMHVLGLWFANAAAAKSLSSSYDNRLLAIGRCFHYVLIHITNYAWINRLTCFSTCGLPIRMLLCVNIIVNKCQTTRIIKYASGQP